MLYKVGLASQGEPLIGGLIIRWVKDARAKGRRPESMLANMSVAEILPEPYIGEDFPGYANTRDLFLHLAHYVLPYGIFFTINKPCQ